MSKYWRIAIFSLSLLIVSIAFLPNLLSFLLANNINSFAVEPLAKSIVPNAYHQFAIQHYPMGSSLWLQSKTKLAETDANTAYSLSQYYSGQKREQQRLLWLNQASRIGHVEAVIALFEHLVQSRRLDEAKHLLLSTAQQEDVRVLEKQIHLALLLGDKALFYSATKQLSVLSAEAEVLSVLSKFQVFEHRVDNTSCSFSFLPVATNYHNMVLLNALVTELKQSQFGQYVCFEPVRYQSLESLECEYIGKTQRISCNPLVWKKHRETIASNYLLVMVPQGGANVNNGIVYIDQYDSFNVLLHEMAHILGFVDEYPLPVNHVKCLSSQQQPFSHNVVVLDLNKSKNRTEILKQIPWASMIKPSTPIVTHTLDGTVIGTPDEYRSEVGIFPTKTCYGERPMAIQDNLQAFKPVSSTTNMEYLELAFPQQYWQIFLKFPDRFAMPSFDENIKKAE